MTEDIGDFLPEIERLLPLQEKLLQAKIRKEMAEAEAAELELAAKKDEERDRLVTTGRIRHLEINDVIGGKLQGKWMDAIRHWTMRDPGMPITITINSPGGLVTDGLAMYDAIMRLRETGSHVTTRASGVAASMAAVLLQAGTERLVDPHAKILIHEGSAEISGTRAEIEDRQFVHDLLLSDILDILASRAKLSKRQIQSRWRRKDWWMSAEDAVKNGFADRVE